MIHRLKTWSAIAALALSGATIGSAQAVATYGNIAAPGVYFGSGNVNGNWTIDTTGGIEVALRAKDRATLATIDGSSGIYHANGGICNPTCLGGTKAAWNYEFSVNTGTDLTGFLTRIRIDTDPSAGQTFTAWLDVHTNWVDNAYADSSPPRRVDTGLGPQAGEFGVQQSANPLFPNSGFGFLPGSGLYDIQLAVFSSTDTGLTQALARTQITVEVPEPGSILLLGMGLVGIAAMRRRKQAMV